MEIVFDEFNRSESLSYTKYSCEYFEIVHMIGSIASVTGVKRKVYKMVYSSANCNEQMNTSVKFARNSHNVRIKLF